MKPNWTMIPFVLFLVIFGWLSLDIYTAIETANNNNKLITSFCQENGFDGYKPTLENDYCIRSNEFVERVEIHCFKNGFVGTPLPLEIVTECKFIKEATK